MHALVRYETRVGRRAARSLLGLLLAAGVALVLSATGASPAGAWGPPGRMPHNLHSRLPGLFHHRHHGHTQSCSGTLEAPGTLSGPYYGTVLVEGACVVNAGQATVYGDLVVRPGATLLAAFALDDEAGSGSSGLTVAGNVLVEDGGTAIVGCEAEHFPCFDDPNQEAPTLSSADSIGGNLLELRPLGVVVHNSAVGRNVLEYGGGGGETCEPSGAFALFGVPVYSDYEDLTVRGTLEVGGLSSCWLGVVRTQVGGDVRLFSNQLADPDAIEIISNEIRHNLACFGNSQVWDSADVGETLFPRQPEPNAVGGRRFGQCVLASPETEGGPPGPGPF